jgi:UPF0755 protein
MNLTPHRSAGRALPIFLMSVLLLLVGTYVLFWPGSKSDSVEVSVAEGASGRQISASLIQNKILSTPYIFLGWVKILRAGAKIQPGLYKFAEGRSAFWILDDLIHNRALKARVVIPEGYASWQIAERLEAARVCSAEDFKKIVAAQDLEGFLFPATYEVNLGWKPSHIAQLMQENLDRRWTKDLDERAKVYGWNKKQVLTFASIIEREVMDRPELPMISALYHNRLKARMPLQADPTVQFSLGSWPQHLTYKDYRKAKSPYNTYLHTGLPPGPICSPGMDSIKAALWPAESDALYMVADGTGRHSFSTSYREHTNKVNRRNRQLRQKKAA